MVRRGQTAGSLSGGERQMPALGRGLIGRAVLLLLDKPSQGLAPRIVEQIRRASNLTILLVEQRVVEALELCDPRLRARNRARRSRARTPPCWPTRACSARISGPDYSVETVYTGPLGRNDREERIPVPRTPTKSYNCSVVSETVSISLRRRQSLGGHGKLFVRCSETECQYIDTNEPPCPLTLQLFEAEIAERMAQRTE